MPAGGGTTRSRARALKKVKPPPAPKPTRWSAPPLRKPAAPGTPAATRATRARIYRQNRPPRPAVTPRAIRTALAQGVMATPRQRAVLHGAAVQARAYQHLRRQGLSDQQALASLAGHATAPEAIQPAGLTGGAATGLWKAATKPLVHLNVPAGFGYGRRRRIGVSALDVATVLPALKVGDIAARGGLSLAERLAARRGAAALPATRATGEEALGRLSALRAPSAGRIATYPLRHPIRTVSRGYPTAAVATAPLAATHKTGALPGPLRLATAPYYVGKEAVTHPKTIGKNFQESLVGIPAGLMYATAHPAKALAFMKNDLVHRYGPLWRGDPKTFEKVVRESGITPFALDAIGAGGGVSQVIGRLGKTGTLGETFAKYMNASRPELRYGSGEGATLAQHTAHGAAARGFQHLSDWLRTEAYTRRFRRPALIPGKGEVVPLTRWGAKQRIARHVVAESARGKLVGKRIKHTFQPQLKAIERAVKHIPERDRYQALKLATILGTKDAEQFVADAQRLADMTQSERKAVGFHPHPKLDEKAALHTLAGHPEWFTPELRAAADQVREIGRTAGQLDPGLLDEVAKTREWAALAQYLGPELRGEVYAPGRSLPHGPLQPPEEPPSGGSGPEPPSGGTPPEPRGPITGNFLTDHLTPQERQRLANIRSRRAPGQVARTPEEAFPGLIKAAGNHTIRPGESPATERFGQLDAQNGGMHLDNLATPRDLFGGIDEHGHLVPGLEPMQLKPDAAQIDAQMGGHIPPGQHGYTFEGNLANELRAEGLSEDEIHQHIQDFRDAIDEARAEVDNMGPEEIRNLENEFEQFAQDAQAIHDLPVTQPDVGHYVKGFSDQRLQEELDQKSAAIDAVETIPAHELPGMGWTPERIQALHDDYNHLLREARDRGLDTGGHAATTGHADEAAFQAAHDLVQQLNPNDPIRHDLQDQIDRFLNEEIDATELMHRVDQAEQNLLAHPTGYEHPAPAEAQPTGTEAGRQANASDAGRRGMAENFFNVDPATQGMPDWYDDAGHITQSGLEEAAFSGERIPPAAIVDLNKLAREMDPQHRLPAVYIPELMAKAPAEVSAAESVLRGFIRQESQKVIEGDTVTLWRKGAVPPDQPVHFATTADHAASMAGSEPVLKYTIPKSQVRFNSKAFPEVWDRASQRREPDVIATATADQVAAAPSPPEESVADAYRRQTTQQLRAAYEENVQTMERYQREGNDQAAADFQGTVDKIQEELRRRGEPPPPIEPPQQPPAPPGGGGNVPPLSHGGTPTGPFGPYPPVDLGAVQDIAAGQGRSEPGYFPSQMKETLRSNRRLGPGGVGVLSGPLRYTGTLFRRGLEDASLNQLKAGLGRNIDRAVSWNTGADMIREQALPISGSYTDIVNQLAQHRIDLRDVVLVNERLLKDLGSDGSQSFGSALAAASHVAATAPEQFTRQQGLLVLPKAAFDASADVPGRFDGLSNISQFLKTKSSRAILGSMNLPWLQFQILSNVAMTGLAKTGPMDIVKAQLWWRKLSEADKQVVMPWLGQGHFDWEGDARPQLFPNTSNALVRTFRAYRDTHPGWSKANPINWLFAGDRKQNALFRRSVLYSQVKRNAYRNLGRSFGKLESAQARINNIFRLGPQDQMREILANKKLMVEHAKYVDDFLGDYLSFGPKERSFLASNVMFYAFLRYSLRMVFYTMPVKHPIMTSILGKIGLLGADQAKKALGPGTLPFQLGRFYYNTGHGQMKVDFSRANPALSALTQNSSIPTVFGSILPPHLQMLLTQVFASTPFQGAVKLGGSTANVNFQHWPLLDPSRARVLARDFLTLYYPYRTAEKIVAGGRDISRDSLLFPTNLQEYTKYKRGDRVAESQQIQAVTQWGPLWNRILREVIAGYPQPATEKLKNKRRLLGGKRAATRSPVVPGLGGGNNLGGGLGGGLDMGGP